MKEKHAGHPGDQAIMRLTVKYTHKVTGKSYWSCVGARDGCDFIRAGNPQRDRILPHAGHCRFLDDDLRSIADGTSAEKSLGSKLGSGSVTPATAPNSDAEDDVPATKRIKVSRAPSQLEVDVTTHGAKLLRDKVDHCIMKLICVNGLVPNILDSENWRELMGLLNHRYKVTSAAEFSEKIIPNEAAHVRKLMMERLQKENNLTLSFDGNSTRLSDSVYFMHVTTKDRNSYFMNGYKGSDERHTAEWVKGKIVKVLRHLRRACVCLLMLVIFRLSGT